MSTRHLTRSATWIPLTPIARGALAPWLALVPWLALLGLLAPLTASASADDIEGAWYGEMPVPGRIELESFTVLLTRKADGAPGELTLHLSVDGITADLLGKLDEATGALVASGAVAGVDITCHLSPGRGGMVGKLNRGGQEIDVRLTRTAPPSAPATLAVDLQVEMPLTVSVKGLSTELAEIVDDGLRRELLRQKAVGVSVAIVMDGAVKDVRSLGFEDFHAGVPATAETMYRWASISKPITAIAAFQLREEGHLDFDADVQDLVPEFPEKAYTVTARHLLAHQSGVVHYRAMRTRTLRDYDVPHPFADRVLALDMFNESDLLFEPGTQYHYSTPGFALLGAVIERAAGQPYADFVNNRIAAPLHMTTLQPDYLWVDIPHRSRGYQRSANGEVIQSRDDNINWKLPAGGFISTVGDLARFGIGLCENDFPSKSSRATPLLTPGSWKELYTEQRTAAGKRTGAGLGIRLGKLAGMRTVEHSGAQNKTATFLVALPERGMAVALMCNTSGTRWDGLGRELLKAIVEHEDEEG